MGHMPPGLTCSDTPVQINNIQASASLLYHQWRHIQRPKQTQISLMKSSLDNRHINFEVFEVSMNSWYKFTKKVNDSKYLLYFYHFLPILFNASFIFLFEIDAHLPENRPKPLSKAFL